jgi:hypothetical protein
MTTTPSFAPISFHFQITKKETENKRKKTVSATEPVVGSPFLSFLQTPACLSPPIITYFKANGNTKYKNEKAHINTVIFPFILPFICFFSFLGFTKHFTKSEGKKRTKHIHTRLAFAIPTKSHSRHNNRKQNRNKKQKKDLTSTDETKKKTKEYATYLKLLPRQRRRLHCVKGPRYVFCCRSDRATERGSKERSSNCGKGKRKGMGDGGYGDDVC